MDKADKQEELPLIVSPSNIDTEQQTLPPQPPIAKGKGRRRESLVLLVTSQQAEALAEQGNKTESSINDLEALIASLKSSKVLAPQPTTCVQTGSHIKEENETAESPGAEEESGEDEKRTVTKMSSSKIRRKSRYMEVRLTMHQSLQHAQC